MIDTELSKAQNLIIKRICQYQLDSLNRILNDETHTEIDIKMFLIENDCDENDFQETLSSDIAKFENLFHNPNDLRVLAKEELSQFRHLLANLRQDYKDKYPNAYRNLWERLYIIEDSQHPKLKGLSLS